MQLISLYSTLAIYLFKKCSLIKWTWYSNNWIVETINFSKKPISDSLRISKHDIAFLSSAMTCICLFLDWTTAPTMASDEQLWMGFGNVRKSHIILHWFFSLTSILLIITILSSKRSIYNLPIFSRFRRHAGTLAESGLLHCQNDMGLCFISPVVSKARVYFFESLHWKKKTKTNLLALFLLLSIWELVPHDTADWLPNVAPSSRPQTVKCQEGKDVLHPWFGAAQSMPHSNAPLSLHEWLANKC